MDELVELLASLSNAPGISGYEDRVREVIHEALEDDVDEIRYDRMGNLIAVKNGGTPSVMVAAHMDEIGLMAKYIDDEGFIRFVTFGGWFDQTLLNNSVTLHTKQGDVHGVIGSKPPHLMEKEEQEKTIKAKDMFIDVGADDREAVKQLGIRPGTPITLQPRFHTLQGSRVTGKALDDRVGVAMMIEAIRRYDGDATLYAVGTVQEEVGLKGAKTSAFGLDPDVALVSETALAGDYPGVEKKESALQLGQGPAVTVTDASGRGLITPSPVLTWLEETATENNIDYQLDVSAGGTTDATAIHLTRAGILSGVIGVPTRYLHSGVEVADLRDLERGADLIAAAVKRADRYFTR
ncbi:MAG: M42 family metallopeptidase [Thermoplasmatota archaeon]